MKQNLPHLFFDLYYHITLYDSVCCFDKKRILKIHAQKDFFLTVFSTFIFCFYYFPHSSTSISSPHLVPKQNTPGLGVFLIDFSIFCSAIFARSHPCSAPSFLFGLDNALESLLIDVLRLVSSSIAFDVAHECSHVVA